MLNIHRFAQLTGRLGESEQDIEAIADQRDEYVRELVLRDPSRPHKDRDVISVVGRLRKLQDRLYSRVLLPALVPVDASHGGIKGRSIKTNAIAHAESRFVFKTDIADFYPSVSCRRVRTCFAAQLGCTGRVARLLAKLCTFNDHLALGLVTSPILADTILRTVDARISATCEKANLTYTRFVDDITISGQFDLQSSGIPATLGCILREHGFDLNPGKNQFGSVESTPITGVRVRGGKFDVAADYADELDRQIRDAKSLSVDGVFEGPFYTENQIRGRVTYVAWVNRGRRAGLKSRLAAIDWEKHAEVAAARGLAVLKKTLEQRPIASQSTSLCT